MSDSVERHGFTTCPHHNGAGFYCLLPPGHPNVGMDGGHEGYWAHPGGSRYYTGRFADLAVKDTRDAVGKTKFPEGEIKSPAQVIFMLRGLHWNLSWSREDLDSAIDAAIDTIEWLEAHLFEERKKRWTAEQANGQLTTTTEAVSKRLTNFAQEMNEIHQELIRYRNVKDDEIEKLTQERDDALARLTTAVASDYGGVEAGFREGLVYAFRQFKLMIDGMAHDADVDLDVEALDRA